MLTSEHARMSRLIVQRLTVPVRGPFTERDAEHIQHALETVPGVVHVFVSAATEMAYVSADATLTREGLLVEAVERAGFASGAPARR